MEKRRSALRASLEVIVVTPLGLVCSALSRINSSLCKRARRNLIVALSMASRSALPPDMLAGEGEDLRSWPLALRKGALAELLSDPVDGIFITEYERGEIGDVLFRVACNMGLL
jgi:hypothetical protein